jgi:hypothetical protein
MTSIMPTAEDWSLANRCADRVRAKDVAELVPGDAFVARGSVFTLTGWPVEHGRAIVTVPVDQLAGEVEFPPGRMVPAWQQRKVNYGLIRCAGCGCHVGRGHVTGSASCAADGLERNTSQSDPE